MPFTLSKPNKPSGLAGTQNKPLAGQKRKKTIFDDSDSEGERHGQSRDGNNDQNGAIEITTLGGLGDPDEDNKQQEESSTTSRKTPRNTGPSSLPSAKPPNSKNLKGSIFDDENDDPASGQQQPEGNLPKTKKFGLQTSQPGDNNNKNYINLAALHSSRKQAKEAEQIDPSIYSYDAVYDSIKVKREKSKQNNTDSEEPGSSKYMDALMRSAEIRKRDQLRARDRLLAKEREAEGDEFADKEQFVTAAYRAQQEEVKRLEEEEAKREREEEERRKRTGESGMMGFYRQMLAREEESHGEVMKATEEAARKVAAGESIADTAAAEEGEKTAAQIAAELNAKGASIIVNDEGQVVDKRQLLSAGLNVAPPKPKAKLSESARGGPSVRPAAAHAGGRSKETFTAREAQRARQTEMIAAQLEKQTKEEEEAEQARQKELAEKNRSRKTDSDVSSARERYLARKKEREAQAQAQK